MTDGEKASLQKRVPELFDQDGNLDSSRMTGEAATNLNNVIDHPEGVLEEDTQMRVNEAGQHYEDAYRNAYN